MTKGATSSKLCQDPSLFLFQLAFLVGDFAAVVRHSDRALAFLAEKMKAGNLSEQVPSLDFC